MRATARQTTPIHIDVAGQRDRGWHRDTNEDQFLVADLQTSARLRGSSLRRPAPFAGSSVREEVLLAVADGVGGNHGGEIASEVAIRSALDGVLDALPRLATDEPSPESRRRDADLLAEIVQRADRRVHTVGERRGSPQMATTLTMGLILWPRLLVAHVGDSRAYLLRRGRLRRLTRDHTVQAEILRSQGRSEDPPTPSSWSHVITQAIGGFDDRAPTADVDQFLLAPRDVLLFCSDGLTDELGDDEIATCLGRIAPAEALARDLVESALRAGGRDNVTVVVARIAGLSGSDAEPVPASWGGRKTPVEIPRLAAS